MKNTILLNSYISFSILYLVLILIGKDDFAWFLKPFLVPFLLFAVVRFGKFSTQKWLLIALLFSWIGDVILLFADRNELYFILGLISFLIGHLSYITLFIQQKKDYNGGKTPLFWVLILVVLFYLKSMLALLFPTLGALKIPVTLYATTISIMLIVAFLGYFSWKKIGKYFILIGAVAFVISDSLLAINKFNTALPFALFWIMLPYLMAQYAIVHGILNLNQKNSDN